MAGKIIKEVVLDTHECSGKPNLRRWKYCLLDTGTLWQCDDCHAIWELEIKRYADAIEYAWLRTDSKPKLSPTIRHGY